MTLREPTWDAARAAAYATGVELPSELVTVLEAVDRVLAAPLLAANPLPPFSTSAMDGYAVSGPAPWRVVGKVLAGRVHGAVLASGECVVIATGAAVPDGTTAVLRREHAIVAPDGRINGEVSTGADIRPEAEEVQQGAQVVAAGTRLNPAHAGLAAAAGADQLEVVRRPTAQLLILGDELLHDGPARDGRVRDSLGPQLPGWLARLGVTTTGVTHVPDTLEQHVAALAGATADLVVTTGGTAAGPVDHVHAALEAAGYSLVVDSVAVRPGHPMLLARRDAAGSAAGPQWVLGLPGNPQSAIVALLSLGQPLIARLSRLPIPEPEQRVLAEAVEGPPTETRLALCRESVAMAEATVHPVRHLGSGMLRGLAAADGFAVVAPGGQSAGERVGWVPLP